MIMRILPQMQRKSQYIECENVKMNLLDEKMKSSVTNSSIDTAKFK